MRRLKLFEEFLNQYFTDYKMKKGTKSRRNFVMLVVNNFLDSSGLDFKEILRKNREFIFDLYSDLFKCMIDHGIRCKFVNGVRYNYLDKNGEEMIDEEIDIKGPSYEDKNHYWIECKEENLIVDISPCNDPNEENYKIFYFDIDRKYNGKYPYFIPKG